VWRFCGEGWRKSWSSVQRPVPNRPVHYRLDSRWGERGSRALVTLLIGTLEPAPCSVLPDPGCRRLNCRPQAVSAFAWSAALARWGAPFCWLVRELRKCFGTGPFCKTFLFLRISPRPHLPDVWQGSKTIVSGIRVAEKRSRISLWFTAGQM